MAVFILRTLLFPLWILRLRCAEFAATMLVFPCICCWVWARRAKSSARARSSNCVQAVDVFMTHSLTNRNRKGDNKHPCLTPVCTSKALVSCWPCVTLQVILMMLAMVSQFHYSDSSRMIRSVVIWSVQHLFLQKPACWARSCGSMASFTALQHYGIVWNIGL